MIPTARSITLPLVANSLNSLIKPMLDLLPITAVLNNHYNTLSRKMLVTQQIMDSYYYFSKGMRLPMKNNRLLFDI